jgi:putative heme-binding domain-containing protein
VFNSSKAACAACHPFGYLGGNVGPDLTKIGQVRAERDLLEAIVFPNASFVRSFEPVLVVTRAGKTYNGLVKSESADEIVLATGPKEEARIARTGVERSGRRSRRAGDLRSGVAAGSGDPRRTSELRGCAKHFTQPLAQLNPPGGLRPPLACAITFGALS